MTIRTTTIMMGLGVFLILAGVATPLAFVVAGDLLYTLLSGGSAVPDQGAMVVLYLGSLISVPAGIVLIVVGGVLIPLSRRAHRTRRGFDVEPLDNPAGRRSREPSIARPSSSQASRDAEAAEHDHAG